jgi:NADH-quinone oxidoreductase subunit M
MVAVVIGGDQRALGAFVALAQTDVKRMIAYTSVNHMGYVLLGLGAAGLVASADEGARTIATVGAVYQMVSHGLLTGALFLLSGVLWSRGHTYALDRWGGLARPAPVFAASLAVAAFGSLGLPGLSGFIAEFQVFTGALEAAPVATVIAVVGILVTAGLFLLALQRLLTGDTVVPSGPDTEGEEHPAVEHPAGGTATATRSRTATLVRDLRGHEVASIVPLLALAVVLGLFPRVLLDVVEPAAAAVVQLVAR